jgi:cysteinyl-tRNA synthetase
MRLRLHNSMTRAVEDFAPSDPSRPTMYVCGPTVYDTPHLGNARPAVVFDVLFRVLRHLHGDVAYARNLTDVDDKIMDRAAANGEAIEALTERTVAEYHAVTDALGVLPPTFEPRATGSIPEMLAMIGELVGKGHAYASEGHVLFSVGSFPGHGALSRHDTSDLDVGHRVAPAAYKRDPHDFVLWKPSATDQPGWDSPWGRGRPGWHIECSAMIRAHLGTTIDIHGGGGDLRFPHHDCEHSQSAAANGAPLARTWLHNGMVLVKGRKMSKSEGNFVTVRTVLDGGADGAAIRLALLRTHYRAPLDWRDSHVEAGRLLERWREAFAPHAGTAPEANAHGSAILAPLLDDLNTHEAVTALHALARRLGQASPGEARELAAGLAFGAGLLGIALDRPAPALPAEARALLDRRAEARASRDYGLSDRLRDELAALGVAVKDGRDGQTWTVR